MVSYQVMKYMVFRFRIETAKDVVEDDEFLSGIYCSCNSLKYTKV